MSGRMRWGILQCFAVVAVVAAWHGAVAADKPYVESVERKPSWWGRPARRTPSEQMAYAMELEQKGRVRAAMKQYYRLVSHWPQSPEAVQAQYRYARWMDERGALGKAFDEYQRLFDRFSGGFPAAEVLERQFEIAHELMHRKKGRFLFLPGFAAPERAIPYFQKILTNAPGWERAAEVQFLIGRAHELGQNWEEAIAAYLATHNRYPNLPVARQAGFNAARCYFRLAKEHPNDLRTLENAWAALAVFVSRYSQGEDVEEVRRMRDELYERRAALAFAQAEYYDRITKKPEAARLTYENFLRQFPSSRLVPKAQERIRELGDLPKEAPQ